MIAKRGDDARDWDQENWSYERTEDWNQRTRRPPNEYELLRGSCRRLRYIRTAVWIIAGVVLAGLALGEKEAFD
jgi:hypothetical protein